MLKAAIMQLALCGTALLPAAVAAQSPTLEAPPTSEAAPLSPSGDLIVAAQAVRSPMVPRLAQVSSEGDGIPAWLKWGLVGGVAFGSLSAAASQFNPDVDRPGAGESALRGFTVGFVVVGGGVAVWQQLCKPDSWSRRNGLCDGPRSRR